MTYSTEKIRKLGKKGGIFIIVFLFVFSSISPVLSFNFRSGDGEINLENATVKTPLYQETSTAQVSNPPLNYSNIRELGGGENPVRHMRIPSEPDPQDWVLLNRQSPYEGWGATLTYDPANERALLFGGAYCDYGECYYGDHTWSLDLRKDNEKWEKIHPTQSPPYREYHSAVYDSQRERVVIFGGEQGWGSQYYLRDTWAFDLNQNEWQELTPAGPTRPKLSRHVAVYDSIRDRMIVFSGARDNFGNPIMESNQKIHVLNFENSSEGTWETLYPQGPYPSTREGAVAVFDPENNRMILFGGSNNNQELNDLWALDFSSSEAGTWMNLNPSGNKPDPRWNAAGTYNPINKLFIVSGGIDLSRGVSFDDLWIISLSSANPHWIQLNPAGITPEGRGHHQIIIDEANARMVIYGGALNQYGLILDNYTALQALPLRVPLKWERIIVSGEQHQEYFGSMATIYDAQRDRLVIHGGMRSPFMPLLVEDQVYTIDLSNGSPQYEFFHNSGISRSDHEGIYDALNDRMVIFGGQDGTDNPLNKPHVLDLSSRNNEWQTLDLPNPSFNTRLLGHSGIYDPVAQRMIIYGGVASPDWIDRDDIWALDLTLGQESWTEIVPPGNEPSARFLHSAVYDSQENRMIIFGGINDYYLNDTWALDLTEGEESWTRLETTGEIPAVNWGHKAIYDSKRHQMIVMGGLNDTRDVYALNLDTLVWTKMDPLTENPPAQNDHNFLYDAERDRAILLSGNLDGPRSDDLYYLVDLDF